MPTVHAAKAAFKCKKIKCGIEAMICKDNKLAELDQKLQAEYENTLKKLPKDEIGNQKAMQRGWIKGRNECWKEDDKHQCIVDAYNMRTTDLQIMVGDMTAPKGNVFDCGNQQFLTVFFYNNTQLPAVVMNFSDEQINAYQTLAASGAKYDGRNVSIWNKGNEAALTWYDKTYQCKEIPSSSE